jgi:hypothetical protein
MTKEKLPVLDESDLRDSARTIKASLAGGKCGEARNEIAYLVKILEQIDLYAWQQVQDKQYRLFSPDSATSIHQGG